MSSKKITDAEVVRQLSLEKNPMFHISVSLLTGGRDPHYACGLGDALTDAGVQLDFLGSDELDLPRLRQKPGLSFLNLRGEQQDHAGVLKKISCLARYYFRLLRYAASAKPQVFHILWNNRIEFLDRTLLMLYYKAIGKKVAITVHNVNAEQRDSQDSRFNRATLKIQYRLADRLFVHTPRMKQELVEDFHVREASVTIIPHGINSVVPETEMTADEARCRLQIGSHEKTILFFGTIRPYKGLEDLVAAFQHVLSTDSNYRLVIAGSPKKESRQYAEGIEHQIQQNLPQGSVLQRMEFISDDDTEVYFKAADVLVLPYKEIYQSGVLFLAYTYGLPVIATDVGSLREEIVEGETGFVCPPNDPIALGQAIRKYFSSDLFHDLSQRRPAIRKLAYELHSWSRVAELTRDAYLQLLSERALSKL